MQTVLVGWLYLVAVLNGSGGSVGSCQDIGNISGESAGPSWGIIGDSSGSRQDVLLVALSEMVLKVLLGLVG